MLAPPVGSLEVTIPPRLSTAMQKVTLAQVTSSRPLPSTPVVTVHSVAPPAGSVDVRTSPPEIDADAK